MTEINQDSSQAGTATEATMHVIGLIPGEEFIVLVGTDEELPDEDVTAELRMQAYERRGTQVLGPGEPTQVLQTLTEYISAGIAGNAAWAALIAFPSITRYASRWMTRKRNRLTGADQAAQRAREICPHILGANPTACVVTNVDHIPDGQGWIVALNADGRRIKVVMEASGTMLSVRLRK